VRLDLPSDDEFGEIGRSFESLSARLATTEGDDPGTSARLQSAVELLEDAVGIFAPDGRVLFANAAMRHLVSAGEGGDYSLPADHPWRTLVARTVADGEGGPVSNTDPSETAGAADRLVSCHPIRSPAGRVVAAVILSRNLEYLSKVESTLEYSRKLAALGRLTAGVAHEVKNPLNAMAIHLELLKRKLVRPVADRDAGVTPGTTSAPEELQAAASGVAGAAVANAGRAESQADVAGALGHAGVIEGEIHRLDGVVQGFLKFIRPAELTLQPTDLGALIDDVVRVVQPQADSRLITVRAEHAPGLPFIDADAGMLRQALLNLALNACEAMPGGGTLGIATRQAGQRTVLIEVADTGVGIDPGHLGRIFDLYFTTKPEGSGIGLSLVYRIVQLHDGDIEVESTPGRGTTFRITLPVGNTKAPSRHVNS
jgi:signal transduction histidine kinase